MVGVMFSYSVVISYKMTNIYKQNCIICLEINMLKSEHESHFAKGHAMNFGQQSITHYILPPQETNATST